MDPKTPPASDQTTASLTEAQLAAVHHKDGPLLILAGPGSGKTRVVTHRIAQLLESGVSARNLLGLTFTNKAADEMRLRLTRLVAGQPPWMGTFHGFCSRLLRRHGELVGLHDNFSILDTSDARRMLKSAVQEAGITLTHTSIEAITDEISWAKSSLMLPDNYQPRFGQLVGDLTRDIYPVYRQLLLQANAVDFDDLLLHVATLLADSAELRAELDQRFRYILVDEYQDTNMAQYAIVRRLSIDYPNLAATGDPDQSIYGWRGADVSNILRFEEDYPTVKVIRLEQNYRSCGNILKVADALISHNVHRKPKQLFTENPAGAPVRLVCYLAGQEEADDIANQIAAAVAGGRARFRDFAIFYRVNALSRGLEHALRRLEIPYQVVRGLEFYQRKEVKDLLAYLQLLDNPRNDVALQRIINVPPRGIGKKSLQHLEHHARRHQVSMFEAAREVGLIESLTRRASVAISNFVAIISGLGIDPDQTLDELVAEVVNESGYREHLSKEEESMGQDRLANVEELISAAREFAEQFPDDGLARFLEQAALASDSDERDAEPDQVTLMTMHAAKGLEFPNVFIVGVEAGMLPHERSRDDPLQREEERRLLFVGITRAEQQLQLSYTRRRMMRGSFRTAIASEFLLELPRSEMQVIKPPSASQYIGNSAGAEDHFVDEPLDDQFDGIDAPLIDTLTELEQDPPQQDAAQLTTAAEMLDDADGSAQLAPEDYTTGMLVQHSQYGPGCIIQLSGTGQKRTAMIKFLSGEEKKFRLAFAKLMALSQ
jgi:DNA helicase-2/ATP-dependent DNA helicase PcrA